MIVALKGDSYTTTEDAISAGSLEPAGAKQEEKKERRKAVGCKPRRWSVFTMNLFVIVAETES